MIEVLLALALMACAGGIVGWALARRMTPQRRHDHVVADFIQANRLSMRPPRAELDPTAVTLEGVPLRFVGQHPDGADVWVNDGPLPDVEGMSIGPLPDDTIVVILGDGR